MRAPIRDGYFPRRKQTTMFSALRIRMQQAPVLWLTLIALVPRLLAAVFSQGYYAHDDHFLVIEAAQSWVAGADYNYWLPWNQTFDHGPTGHMMVYPGLHFILFKLCDVVGFTDPDGKMILVRLLHAAWSLVVVRVGYRIGLRLAGVRTAWTLGLFLALLAYMPFLGVRNMVETVSAPFLMLSAWWLLRGEDDDGRWRPWMVAGVCAGLAMNIRFQTVFFPAGVGLALLLTKRVRPALIFGVATLLPLLILQGGIDLWLWGRPFAEMTEYIRYNLDNPDNTGIISPWYNYLLLLSAAFVPPLSVAVLFGMLRSWRPLVLWLPVVLFVVFHSLFPNKQERFMLPILPLFFTLGFISWELWRAKSTWWSARPGLWNGALAATWIINALLLVPLTFSSSKLERVEAMRLLRDDMGLHGIIIDDVIDQDAPLMPRYYLDRWKLCTDPFNTPGGDMKALVEKNPPAERANAVMFIGQDRIEERLAEAFRAFGDLEFVGIAQPGLLDRTLHWLNPQNRNMVVIVFRTPRPRG